jgi:hypothetical protein
VRVLALFGSAWRATFSLLNDRAPSVPRADRSLRSSDAD